MTRQLCVAIVASLSIFLPGCTMLGGDQQASYDKPIDPRAEQQQWSRSQRSRAYNNNKTKQREQQIRVLERKIARLRAEYADLKQKVSNARSQANSNSASMGQAKGQAVDQEIGRNELTYSSTPPEQDDNTPKMARLEHDLPSDKSTDHHPKTGKVLIKSKADREKEARQRKLRAEMQRRAKEQAQEIMRKAYKKASQARQKILTERQFTAPPTKTEEHEKKVSNTPARGGETKSRDRYNKYASDDNRSRNRYSRYSTQNAKSNKYLSHASTKKSDPEDRSSATEYAVVFNFTDRKAMKRFDQFLNDHGVDDRFQSKSDEDGYSIYVGTYSRSHFASRRQDKIERLTGIRPEVQKKHAI